MIIKCKYCKREFDTKRQCKDHERDAHQNMPWIEWTKQQFEKKPRDGAVKETQ